MFLAFEMSGGEFHARHQPQVRNVRSQCFTPSSILLRSHPKRGSPKLHFPQLVQFADTIEVKIYEEFSSRVQHFCCSTASFRTWVFKPWSLYPGFRRPCLPVQLPCGDCLALPDVLTCSLAEQKPVTQAQLFDLVPCDPLSEEAVSISHQSQVPLHGRNPALTDSRVVDSASSVLSPVGSHVDDFESECSRPWSINVFFGFPIHGIERPQDVGDQPAPESSSSSGPPVKSDSAGRSSNPPLPEVPQFARDVSAAFEHRMRSYVPTDVTGPWIRVWYIHLEFHIRSYFARHIQLQGPPHTWRAQVISLWQDVLLPDVDDSIDLVTPTPPREVHELDLVCDVILAQGIGGRSVAGLVTARPVEPAAGPRQYSGAVAFGAAVSKGDIISGLALDQTCRIMRHCHVRHGRTVFSQTALHQMQPGYGFLIDVGHPRSVAAGSTTSGDPSVLWPLNVGVPPNHDQVDFAASVTSMSPKQLDGIGFSPSSCPPCVMPVRGSRKPVGAAHESGRLWRESQPYSSCPSPADDPLSIEAVSISQSWCPVPVVVSAIGVSMKRFGQIGVLQAKLTDSSNPDGDFPDRAPHALRPVAPPTAPIQPIVIPAFVHDMFLDLPEEFLDANVLQRGFLVRTWYIHHCTIRRSRVSRCIQLRGPPTTWQSQILTVWFDVLVPHEAVEIDLVKPRPPRDRHEARLAFDIILSQGLEVDRFAGLITVNPSVRVPQVPRFAMAVSFPPETHGQMIIDILAFHRVCHTFQCFVAHRWDQLPISPLPVHMMQPGDSFVVGVFTRIPEHVECQDPDCPNQPASSSHGPQPMDCDSEAHVDEVEDSSSDAHDATSGSSQNASDTFRRQAHLYRLGHTAVTAIVHWPLSASLVELIASSLGIGPWEIVAVHPVQAKPVGIAHDDYAFIVQVIDDILPGLLDQLCLIDVFVHQHESTGSPAPQVFHDRRVIKPAPSLTRGLVLQLAHLDEYCEFVQNRCLVKTNGVLWPFQDVAVRPIARGHYFQVIVPPHRSRDVPVLRAIEIVEDFGRSLQGDSFGAHYPAWGSFADDHPLAEVPHSDADVGLTHAIQTSSKLVGCSSSADFVTVPTVEHANEDQVQDPPDFVSGIGTVQLMQLPAQNPLPPFHGLQEFLLAFGVTVERLAEEEFEGQGPVVQVVTWYVHHGRYPVCQRHHTVELGNDPATWPASLCAPWTDMIQPDEPLALREVLPNPPRHHHQRHVAHVIVEQGLSQARYASLFSILVQGTHHDGMIQKAYSTPQSVAAEDLLTIAGLRDRCHLYRCTAWSGVMMFHPAEPEPIFSGISIKLHVHRPQCRHHLLDFGDQAFWHPPPYSAASSSTEVQARVFGNDVPCPREVLAEPEVHPHFDGLFRPDLLTAWHVFLAQATSPPFLFRVQTWFCDHFRMPRSNEGRIVQLPVEADSWKPTLYAAWSDWILPGIDVQYYVVQPEPPSAALDVVAHVIIAQNQLPDFVSVLISSLAPEDDPYFPSHRVVKLPRIVDHWMLVHEGGLMLYCPPFAPQMHCSSWIGPTQITPHALRPSMSGDGFFVTAEAPPAEATFAFHSTLHRIDRLFSQLADLLGSIVNQVCHAASGTSVECPWSSHRSQVPAVAIPDYSCAGPDFEVVHQSQLTDGARSACLGVPVRLSLADHLPPPIRSADDADGFGTDEDFAAQLQRAVKLHPPVPSTTAHRVSSSASMASCHAGVSAPVTLSLEACLGPSREFDPARQHTPEGLCWNFDWPQIIAASNVEFSSLPCGLDLKATTLHALDSPTLYVEPFLAGKSVFYVDGSADDVHAAWSVVSIRYTSAGVPLFHGCLSGQVQLNESASDWIGAQAPDNIAAEITAVVAAMIATLQLDSSHQVVVRPDLQLSVRLAEGLWTCRSHSRLVDLCHVFGHWFRKASGEFHEVRGHSDHPWNELADVLARAQLGRDDAIGRLDWTPFGTLVQSGDLRWAWLFDGRPHLHKCFPPGAADGCWQITPSMHRVPVSHDPVVPPQSRQVEFLCATANVLALGAASDSAPQSQSERVVRLDHQWHQRRLAVIGLQEARRASGKYTTDHYVCFSSGAQVCNRAHHFGCEIWLHQTLPLLTDGSLAFRDFQVAVVVADPRRLVLNLTHHQLTLSFVVLHVPCVTASMSLEAVQQWWDVTTELLEDARLAPLTWCFVDLNAPLASQETPFFGLTGAEPSNPQGAIAENALQSLAWYVPSTMSWCHDGSHATWTHPRGQKLRRDFVCCSSMAFALCTRTWVDVHFDGGFGHDDHFPVMLQCNGWLEAVGRDDFIRWDPLASVDPIKCSQFQDAVRTLPIPTWDVHIDSHAQIFEDQILSLAKQHFVKTSKERTRPRLTERTLHLIQFKRSCLDYGRCHDLMHDAQFRQELHAVEKDVRQAVRLDQRAFYAALVDQLAHAGQLHDAKTMYRLLSRLGGRPPKHSSIRAHPLIAADGQCQPTFEAQQRLWMRQFAEVEAGNIMSKSEFLRLLPPALGVSPDVFNIDVIPTLAEVRAQVHRLKRGKAPGPDRLPPDVLKAGAEPLAKHITTLVVKTAAHAREPGSWRGGRLIPLHKGKLPKTDPQGYRSIFLNGFVTKTYHSAIRRHLVESWNSVLTHLQIGGRKGLGCDSAHHIVQAHLAHGAVKKLPVGVVFVDFRAAFYSVLRQCLFAHPLDETGFLIAMARLGIHPDHVHGMLQHASSEAAIRNICPHALLLLQDVLRSTYFQIDGISEVATTNRGTRPGDPIGDIAFNMLMAVLMKEITAEMQGLGRPGTRVFKENLHLAQSRLQVEVHALSCTVSVPVVLSYKHLGTWIHNDAKPLHAIRDRVAAARKAWGPLVRPFFSKRSIALQTKVRVFESLVMSRFLFNAHVWCLASPQALDEWANALRPMLYALARPALRGLPPFSFGIDTLCGLCSLLPPADALHAARLRYLRRLVGQCPNVLWNLLTDIADHGGAWLSLLRDSFAWLTKFSSVRFGLSADSALSDWLAFVSIDSRWKGRINRAIAACRSYRHTHATSDVWHAWLSSAFAQWGVDFSPAHAPNAELPWTCDLCTQSFPNKVALSMHAVKVHGYQTLVRHYAVDGQCPNCSRDYHNRARLCAHLRTADACLARIRAVFPPLTKESLTQLNLLDLDHAHVMKQQGWLATKAKCPVVRAFGPILPPPDSVDAQCMFSKWVARNGVDPHLPYEQLVGSCLHADAPEELGAPLPASEVDCGIAFVMHSASGVFHGDNGVFSMKGLAKLYARLHIRTICFVHFYSGFRREGDLQHQIDRHVVQGVYQIFCLSIDFCLHGTVSDLTKACQREFWTRQIQTGAVVGIGGGPPCETFTAARLMDDGPPVLRTHDEPLGVPHNSPRQWRQVMLGTTLMQFILEMAVLCARHGGCAFVEHPAFPLWARHHRPVSIWSSQVMRWLKRLHCSSIVTYDQCIFACEARKPTTLLLIRLPHLRDYIMQLGDHGRCAHPAGTHVTLRGRDQNGSFKTAIAKVYPPAMNEAIARAIIQFVQETFEAGACTDPLPADLAALLSFDFVSKAVVQNDCHWTM
eukprot:s3128_g2.t2